MSFIFIDDAPGAARLAAELRLHSRIALDCEAAGFHRYSDRLCLVQISTPEGDYILDPLAFDPSDVLRPVLEDPGIELVVHGADYDLRLLDRDLDIRPQAIFDTQPAAALLGEPSLGLAALLERHLGIVVSKKHQRADWARRPLPEDMLEYATTDTRHLLQLSDLLRDGLEKLGRLEWAREEFRALERIRWEGPDEDPVVKVRGSKDLGLLELAALRATLVWRDRVARKRDRAPFRVAGDQALLDVARARPASLDALAQVPGMNPNLARTEGEWLIEQIARLTTLAPAELLPYPERRTNGRGRPPPEIEELTERLKVARNRRAETLGIDRGTLMPNSVINEIAWVQPKTLSELHAIQGVKVWQADAVGPDLLEVLSK